MYIIIILIIIKQKIVLEMDNRYEIFSKKGVKKITEYNRNNR